MYATGVPPIDTMHCTEALVALTPLGQIGLSATTRSRVASSCEAVRTTSTICRGETVAAASLSLDFSVDLSFDLPFDWSLDLLFDSLAESDFDPADFDPADFDPADFDDTVDFVVFADADADIDGKRTGTQDAVARRTNPIGRFQRRGRMSEFVSMSTHHPSFATPRKSVSRVCWSLTD
jgi:hypothetical protein